MPSGPWLRRATGPSRGGARARVSDEDSQQCDDTQRIQYSDSALAKFLHKFFANQLSRATPASMLPSPPASSERDEFAIMIDAAMGLSRMPGEQARERTLQLLYALFPPGIIPAVRHLFAAFPMWFVARHGAVLTVALTYWLVGKSVVQDVEAAQLDADSAASERSNTPTGWVPGFALGGKWRAEVGASQGVLVERCRVLETSGCASVCANVCKVPASL